MSVCIEWRSLAALPVLVSALFFSPTKAETQEATPPVYAKQPFNTLGAGMAIETPAESPVTGSQTKMPASTPNDLYPDGWEKLAGNHIEEVYIKPTPHGLDPNITGIEVKVVARTKELFDYAEGVAMADCEIRKVFPVSGDIYDVNGNTIDPMHIPLLKGMVYIREFPQEAYDGLAERLCAGQPALETPLPTTDN
ncbi:MAG: hypothetical protein IKI30_00955 [Oxalobacter sp.]|nr:hypothetical protein [Oxalobacter sp.]